MKKWRLEVCFVNALHLGVMQYQRTSPKHGFMWRAGTIGNTKSSFDTKAHTTFSFMNPITRLCGPEFDVMLFHILTYEDMMSAFHFYPGDAPYHYHHKHCLQNGKNPKTLSLSWTSSSISRTEAPHHSTWTNKPNVIELATCNACNNPALLSSQKAPSLDKLKKVIDFMLLFFVPWLLSSTWLLPLTWRNTVGLLTWDIMLVRTIGTDLNKLDALIGPSFMYYWIQNRKNVTSMMNRILIESAHWINGPL